MSHSFSDRPCGEFRRAAQGALATIALLITCAAPARADSFDWRNVGGSWLTPVRSQDGGTCWDYAGVGAIEARLKLTRGDLSWNPDLSEHQVVNQLQTYTGISGVTYDSGGWPTYTYNFAKSAGIVFDSEVATRTAVPAAGWENRVCKIDSYTTSSTTVANVKAMLQQYGPVAVALYSGDLGTSTTNIPVKSGSALNHAVLCVGWQDDAAMPEGGYFIIKNSWGSWGQQGYGYVRYNAIQYNIQYVTSRAYFNGAVAGTTWTGGAGAWSNNTAGWDPAVNSGKWRNGEDAATFSTGAGAITVGANTSAHALTINAGAVYDFTGGSLTITGGGINAHENASFATPITVGYDQSWTVDPALTLTARNVNLHINTLTLAGDGDAIINGPLTDVRDNAVFNSLLGSSVGSLAKTGNGLLTLASANTFRGETRVAAGTLRIGHALSLQNSTLNIDSTGAGTVDLNNLAATLGGLKGGRALAIPAGLALTVGGNNSSNSYSGAISGEGSSFIKIGAGLQTLSGANTYTGGTTVAAGGVVFANADSFPTVGTIRLDAAGYVGAGFAPATSAQFLDHFDKAATAGVIGFDSGANAANVDLTGFDPGVRIGSATTATLSATFTPQADTYRFGGAGGTLTVTSQLDGTRNLDMGAAGANTGTVILKTANAYTGSTTINAGTLRFGIANALPTTTAVSLTGGTLDMSSYSGSVASLLVDGGTLSGAGKLTVNTTLEARAGTISAPLGGSAYFIKNGPGIITLSGANTFAGVDLNAGTIATGNASSLGGGRLAFGGGTLQVTGQTAFSFSRAIQLNSPAIVQVDNTAGATFSGQIAGAAAFTKTGTGALALSGANLFDAPATVAAGTLEAQNTAALGTDTNPVIIAANATLRLKGAFTFSKPTDITGQGDRAGGALKHASGSNTTVASSLTIRGDASNQARIQNDGNNFTFTGPVNNLAQTLTFANNVASAKTYLNTPVGGTHVLFTSAGSTTINSAMTHTGATRVDGAATLVAGVNQALPAATSLSLGSSAGIGTLDLAGRILNIANLASDPGVNGQSSKITSTAAAALTINNATANSFIGSVQGAVSLEKSGAGVLTLAGTNTMTGPVVVAQGTLKLGAPGAGLYEGRVSGQFNTTTANPKTSIQPQPRYANIKDTGAAYAATGGAWADNTTFIYTGYINNASADSVTWTFAENFDDSVMLKIDTTTVLNNGSYTTPTTANYTLTPGRHVFELRLGQGNGGVGPSNKSWLTGNIGFGYDPQGRNLQVAANYVPLVDPGDGSLFTTASTISPTAALPANAVVQVAPGATLDLGGISRSFGSISDYTGGGAGAAPAGASTVQLGSANLAIGTDNSSTIFCGSFAGAGGITKTGTGTLTLGCATHSFTGPLTLVAGKLIVNGSIASSSGVSVDGGTFEAAPTGGTSSAPAATTLASLTVKDAAAKITSAALAASVLVTSNLSLTGTGSVDVTTNGMVIDYTTSSPADAIRDWIISGRNNGAWDGPGIRSTDAAANAADRTVGYAEASAIFGAAGTFMGRAVDASAILVRYTIPGDFDLDGNVTFADLARLAQNYQSPGTWAAGDVNYDGAIGFADLVMLAQHYDRSLAAAPLPGASAQFNADFNLALTMVPEPGALSLLALAALLLSRRPRS